MMKNVEMNVMYQIIRFQWVWKNRGYEILRSFMNDITVIWRKMPFDKNMVMYENWLMVSKRPAESKKEVIICKVD